MGQVSRQFIVLAVILVVLNIGGLLWIHHDLTARGGATVYAKDVSLRPDNVSPDYLRIVFDRNIAPRERIGEISECSAFVFEPHREGVWKWIGENTLAYYFDEPLPPGRMFELKATEQFRSEMGMSLAGQKAFALKTISLALFEAKVTAADWENVTVELNFNQPVAPGDLLRRIRFYDAVGAQERELASVRCLTQDAAKQMVVQVGRPGSNKLRIMIDQHLAGPNADLSLGHNVVRDIAIGDGFCYLSSNVSRVGLEEIISVRLRFSKPLNLTQELPPVKVTPEVEELKTHRNNRDVVLAGRFVPGMRYTAVIPATLMSSDNETLRRENSVTFEIPGRRPEIRFSNYSGILSPGGNLMLDMKAVNVKGARFHVWRVHENNLASHVQGQWRNATSRMMPVKTMEFESSPNEVKSYAVDIRELISGRRGIYHIEAESVSPRYLSTQSLVTVTDMALTVKRERDGCLVWVTSLRTGTAVEGAKVDALSYNNQVLTSAVTDGEGIAHLGYSDRNPDGSMWLIAATRGDDMSYLTAADNQWMIDDVDQSGRDYPDDVEVMLYTERGAYRPGDTVHLTGIVRQRDGGTPPAFPFSIHVVRPDGRKIAEVKAGPSEHSQGMFHADVPTREDCQTGPYSFRAALPGDETVLGATVALVEAFLPQRMKVESAATAQRYEPNDVPAVAVETRYLWDAPAADVPVKAEAWLYAMRFESRKHKGYVFGLPLSHVRINAETIKGNLDGEGKATLEIPLPEGVGRGLYRMGITATVTEPGGRSISSNSSAVVDRLNHHIGLRLAGEQIVRPGQAVGVEWVSLGGGDELRSCEGLEARLEVVEYETVLKEVNGRQVWRSEEKATVINTVAIVGEGDSGGSFEITCPDAGHYRLTVSDKATQSATQLEMYSSHSGSRQSLEMNNPERLEIVCDKRQYVPGDTVKVLVRSPVSGRMLCSMETDRVVQWKTSEVVNNTAEVEFALDEESRGSAFVTATVVRAIDPNEMNWLPHRAMGMKRIVFDHQAKRFLVSISTAEKSGPGEEISIDIETRAAVDPNNCGMIHMWAVDEGILLPTNYETPDAFAYFLSPRRAAVYTSDVFYELLPDFERPATIERIGADGGYDVGALRRNPVSTVRREPDVVWRKAVSLDREGKAKVQMKLPELIGQMRIMAVAVEGDSYGKGEKPVVLTSDLIVESTWPRFAAPGDVFNVPVKMFNSTDKTVKVNLDCDITGPVEVGNVPAEAVEIGLDKPVTVLLHIKAGRTGAVHVEIRATAAGGGEVCAAAVSKADFAVRPATAVHGVVALKEIKAGEELRIEPSEAFIPGTEQLTLNISPLPTVQLGPALEKLIGYPYGCVEQTTSRMFALLYAPGILGEEHTERINAMVQAGIARLWSMQTRSGGLSCWPGGTDADPWGSAFAGWCLLECRNAGYEVDERFTNELMEYLDSQLQSTAATNRDDLKSLRALWCHVLSTFGKSPHGWMNRLAEMKDSLDIEQRAHLAGAFAATGDKDRALRLLPPELVDVTIDTTTSGRLTSYVQQHAVWLSVLLQVDPENIMVGPLVNLIMKSRQNGCWSSTLSNGAAIVAISRYQATRGKQEIDFGGSVRISESESAQFSSDKTSVHKVRGFTEPIVISSSGKGSIYVALSSEGLAGKGLVQPYDKRLKVTRKWTDRTGKAVDPNGIHVGDLVNVEIQMHGIGNRRVDNIAVVDALAGGMEVENPRLASSADSAEGGGNRAEHVEFLDDRVVLFSSAYQQPRTFRYALRATTAGRFDLPPIQASCMYDPSIASLGKAGTVTILP
jgi:hypothetical protein